MSDRLVLTNEQNYEAIADAIRAKNGSSATYYPGDMAAAIAGITTMSAEVDGATLILTGGGASVSGTTLELTGP